MLLIHFIGHDGRQYDVETAPGTSVMQAALNASVPGILAECGGMLSCATCHGYVDSEWLSRLVPPSSDERDMLACALDPAANSRLCCQLIVTQQTDGIIVRLPKAQL